MKPDTITIDGHALPCLARTPGDGTFIIPLENGWHAWVRAMPRPDEVEYHVCAITRLEADRAIADNPLLVILKKNIEGVTERPACTVPRGEWFLYDEILALSTHPKPEVVA